VFVFLTTLVVATQLMSLAVRRFAPVPAPEVSPVTAEELAAITAAIHQHRRQASAPRAES
jgi:sodium pump decarboxylase gamma subunit